MAPTTARLVEVSATFPALGTSTFVAVRDPAELSTAVAVAREVLTDVDETCSRFRDDSDLARVNAHPGRWVEVDPLLVAAVEVAVAAARETGGLVHPLLGRQLVQLGYDRDFDLLVDLGQDAVDADPATLGSWRLVDLDPAGALRIPAGTSLDLGATGKAWAADLVAVALEEQLGSGAIVSVGGDVRIADPDGTPWPVRVTERPGDHGDPAGTLVELDSGGLATSSTQVRRWSRSGVRRHHLLDPRTGQPAREVWRTVTATGATCTAANAATTAAVVLGEDAPDWLDDRGVSARLVGADGSVRTTGAWPHEEDGR